MTPPANDSAPFGVIFVTTLLHSLAKNHALVGGNKRIAWMAATVFLEVNDHPLDLEFDQQAAEDLVVAVAVGDCDDIKTIANELVKFAR